jgi:hypothetical protein
MGDPGGWGSWLPLLLIVVVWFALNRFILPRLGVPT